MQKVLTPENELYMTCVQIVFPMDFLFPVGKNRDNTVHVVSLIIQTILLSTAMVSVCRILLD